MTRRPMPPAVAEWLAELEDDQPLDPPAYVTVSVEIGGETAVDHLDRIIRTDIETNIGRTLGVDPNRITLIITVDQ